MLYTRRNEPDRDMGMSNKRGGVGCQTRWRTVCAGGGGRGV